ncbi:DUF7779 domain-containing protein, partial [Magnetococcales bacterium HHB-1]
QIAQKQLTGKILITSRTPRWGRIGQTLEVKPLPLDRATQILMKLTKADDTEKEQAEILAEHLGGYPLALVQAAAYIYETAGMTFSGFHKLYDQVGGHRLLNESPKPADYHSTISQLFTLSVQKLIEKSPLSQSLLQWMVFLAPEEPITDFMLSSEDHDPLQRADAFTQLVKHALIREQKEGLVFHKLVQDVIRDSLSDEEKKTALEQLLTHLENIFVFNELDMET